MKPDVALELAWRHKVVDFIMPYLIHVRNIRLGKATVCRALEIEYLMPQLSPTFALVSDIGCARCHYTTRSAGQAATAATAVAAKRPQ